MPINAVATIVVAETIPPTTIPPVTFNAALDVFAIKIVLVVEFPRLVTDCSVEVVQTVTAPVLVLTAVSVPANIPEI